MSNAVVKTYPDVLSASAALGGNIVHRAAENLGKIVPEPFAEGRLAESNKHLCRRFIQKVLNEGELSLIGDFMSPGVVNHEIADSLGPSRPGQGHGVELMLELVYLYRRAFPDLRLEILDQIAEDDRVVTCLRIRGTQQNALMSIAASGRKIDIAGIRVDRILGDRIVESWFHADWLGMLRQLDALPALNRRPQPVTPVTHETAPRPRRPFAVWDSAPALPHPDGSARAPGALS